MARKKKRPSRKPELDEEAQEELLALAAIFDEHFVLDEDGRGFKLVVVPHPGDAQASHVSAELSCRLPPGYPRQRLVLHVSASCLDTAEARALTKALHAEADALAADGRVCCFNVAERCQDFLQQHNEPPSPAGRPEPASLWDTWLERETANGPQPDAAAGEAGGRAADPGWLSAGGGLFGDARPSSGAAARPAPAPRHAQPERGGGGAVPAAAPEAPRPADAADSPPADASSEPGSGRGSRRREDSRSMVGSLLSAVGRSVAAWLPPALRRALDTGSERGSEEGADADREDDGDAREQVRRDLLLGHLLLLATADGGAHAAHALASSLAEAGLLPRWVHLALTQHPDLFARAFRRMFAAEAGAAPGADPAAAWALERFWQRPGGAGGALGPAPPAAGAAAGAQAAPAPPSRFLVDFQELRVLGRGGYGVVVQAVNRLDGRTYAVKKIAIRAVSPAARGRLMREVSTLARLHHPGIVRYYQAWCEAPSGEGPDWLEGSESGDWLTETSQRGAPPAAALLGVARCGAPAGAPAGLPHVAEASSEGAPSSLFGAAGGSGDSAAGDGARPALRRHSNGSGSSAGGGDGAAEAPAGEPGPGGGLQMLYIQMEFCPRTLRQALDEGPMHDPDAWQVVRQLLAGLAHIHAQGIIHRDLKPANIFFDSRGDIKLGDFGLAKFASSAAGGAAQEAAPAQLPGARPPPRSLRLPGHQPQPFPAACWVEPRGGRAGADTGRPADPAATHRSMASEATGRVGTSFYISPEIRDGWARYDERTDLFSLGIVAFELWHPFATGMERAVLLADLQATGALPAEWETAHPQAARLVRWLTQQSPAVRPSAPEVLRSALLPPDVADEQLTDLLRAIPERPETATRVTDALFALPTDAGVPLDEVAGAPVAMPPKVEAREAAVEVLCATFALHGAVPMGGRKLGFRAPGAPPDTAALLAASGARLAARHEMRGPFAAWLARRAAMLTGGDAAALDALRRYEVGWVWRRGVGRAPPRAYLQADLDLVMPPGLEPAEALLGDAEAIRAVVEVLQALPETPGEWEVRLGHAAILEAALGHARVPRELRGAALDVLGAMSAGVSPRHAGARMRHWAGVRAALAGLGLPERAVTACKHFVAQVPGEATAALHRLRSKLDSSAGPRGLPPAVAAALEALAELAGHLRAWGLAGAQLAVDPLLRPHADGFSGVAYQVHLVTPASGASQLVAVGGRWDGLLQAAWAPFALSAGAPPCAAGVTLNVDRLLDCLPAARAPALRASQAEVLVCARGGGGLLQERMMLAARLWDAGVRAEILPAAAPSLTAQYEYARARGIAWLAILAADTLHAADTVRVKSLDRRTEEDVPVAELARYLAAALPRLAALRRDEAGDADEDGSEDAPDEPLRRRSSRR